MDIQRLVKIKEELAELKEWKRDLITNLADIQHNLRIAERDIKKLEGEANETFYSFFALERKRGIVKIENE